MAIKNENEPKDEIESKKGSSKDLTVENTKTILNAQPKVKIMIASTETDRSDVVVPLNGYPYIIQRDKEVSIPRDVYKQLQNCIQTTYTQKKKENGEGMELVAHKTNRFPITVLQND